MRSCQLILLYLLTIFFSFTSCKKESVTPTQLQVTVRDKNEDLVSGASVYLYGTENDWANGTNLLYSGYTNTKGEALIDLEDRKYYVYVNYNCLVNRTANTSDYTLVVNKNTLNKREIKVIGAGLLSLKNNYYSNTIRFHLYQNNQLRNSFQIGPSSSIKPFWYPDGFYDITVEILPNGAKVSLGQYYLNCGGALNLNYP